MANIRQIRARIAPTGAIYERLLATMGTEEFGATVREAIMSVTNGARRIYLFEATGRLDSTLQYFFGEPGLSQLFPTYLSSYLRLDPVCDAYRAAPECMDMALQVIRPSDIASEGFRQRVFEGWGIIQRASVIQRADHCWRVVNVARHVSDGVFTESELNALVDLAGLVLPMVPINRQRKVARISLGVEQLEERFSVRFGDLPARERQVCARAAIGMSVEATALDLGIAKSSVITYRQRAYRRLAVTSPIELCRLVTH